VVSQGKVNRGRRVRWGPMVGVNRKPLPPRSKFLLTPALAGIPAKAEIHTSHAAELMRIAIYGYRISAFQSK
jgi:hypothetical protein